jgi:large subunit ribosomal protein L3
MGDAKVTVQNLTVFKVDKEAGILLIRGAVPGAEGGLLYIQPAKKKGLRA